ncbi:MAG TPA: hypothetical protein VM938_10595 [Acidimicrobiales bacterium]|nr:hypothetical protein [Acidimicrobiales bacterium]
MSARFFNADEDAAFERMNAELARMRTQRATANVQTVSNLASIRRIAPWMPPGTTYALAAGGHDGASPVTQVAAQAAAKRKVKRGLGWHSIGDVVTATADAVSDAVKPVVRSGLTALSAPLEEAQGLFREGVQMVREEGFVGAFVEHAKQGGAVNMLADNIVRGQHSTAGQSVRKVLQGEAVDLGSGFMPGGQAVQDQAAYARTFGTTGGKAITPGRFAASLVVEPGTTPFNVLSGLTDAAVAIYADPGGRALDGLGAAAKANKLFDPPSVGLVNGNRTTVLSERAEQWLAGDGSKVVDYLATETNLNRMRSTVKGKLPVALLRDLTDARTTDEVVDVLAPALGVAVRSTDEFAMGKIARFAPDFRKRLDGVRMLQQMPGEAVDVNDLDDVVERMDRFMRNAKLPGEVVDQRIDELARTENRVDLFRVVTDVLTDTMTKVGDYTDANTARRMTGIVRNYNDEMAKYFVDELANNVPIFGVGIDGVSASLPSPHLAVEYLNRSLPLPDARAIRRMTSRYGRLLNKPALDLPVAFLDFALQDVWKPMVLIRGAWTVRVIGEEQVRMAASGMDSLFRHPLSYIAWATGRRGGAGLTGEGFADASAAAADADEFAKAMSRNGGGWRDRVVHMGKRKVYREEDEFPAAWGDELLQLRTDPVASRVAGGWADGDAVPGRTVVDIIDEEVEELAEIPGSSFYHGTSRRFLGDAIDPDEFGTGSGADNLFGPGFYLTDNPDVARSYTKKGKGNDPRVYGVEWAGDTPPRLIDIERPLPEDVRGAFRRHYEGFLADSDFYVDTEEAIRRALDDPSATGARLYQLFRRAYGEAGMVKYEVDESLHSLHDELVDLGYDGFTYKGGVRTKSQKHNPVVIFRPAKLRVAHSTEPVTRRTVQSTTERFEPGLTGNHVEDAKRWFWEGPGQKFRDEMAGAEGREMLNVRHRPDGTSYRDDGKVLSADDYIDSVFHRLQVKTGGDQRLTDAVATGVLDGEPIREGIRASKALRAKLDALRAEGVGPEGVKGDIALVGRGSAGGKVASALDHAVDTMFSVLMSKPTNKLSRSPSFRQFYWQRVEELLPGMDAAAQAAARQAAEKAGLGRSTLKRFDEQIGRSDAAPEGFVRLYRGEAEHLTPEQLAALPADARENVGRWFTHRRDIAEEYAKGGDILAVDVPSAVFDEKFTALPGDRGFAVLPAEWAGAASSRSGLTLDDVDTLAKGFGLDKTKELLYDLSDRSQFFDITRHIFPFGEAWKEVGTRWAKIGVENPKVIRRGQQLVQGARGSGFFYTDETTGEEMFAYPGSQFVTEKMIGVPVPMAGRVQGLNVFGGTVLPGFGLAVTVPAGAFLPDKPEWDAVRKIVMPFGELDTEGGLIESVLPAWLQKFRQTGKTPFGRQDDRMWNNTVWDVARYLKSTGDYPTDSIEGQERLLKDAKDKAKLVYALRGAAQFVAPSAPSPRFLAFDKDGNLLMQQRMIEEYQKLDEAEKAGGTPALEAFLERFGEDALLVVQGKTEGPSAPTKEVADWQREHPELARRFPDVYGFFAPGGGEFDIDAYTRQIASGERKAISPEDALKRVNARIAGMVYRNAKDKLGDRRDPGATEWLRTIREALMEEYPGYDPGSYDPGRTDRNIRQVEAALEHEAVRATDAGEGARLYLLARERAIESAKASGLTTFGSAKKARGIRQWLRAVATSIAEEHPGFAPLYERVFEQEMVDDREEAAA